MGTVEWVGGGGDPAIFEALRDALEDPANANSMIAFGMDGSYSVHEVVWDVEEEVKDD